jgi:DNA-binding MarR family transcriptional regulator
LQQEIKQTRPFESLESEVFLNLVRTVDALDRPVTELLKQAGLTASQYNALRILRGAGPNGLMCAEVSDRMLARDPDVTRLLDRLERRVLITRTREKSDRRVVTTRITDEGLSLLEKLDEPVERAQHEQLAHMSREDLDALRRLLEAARRA